MNELTQSLLKAISRYDMNLKGEYKRVRKLEQLSHPYVKQPNGSHRPSGES